MTRWRIASMFLRMLILTTVCISGVVSYRAGDIVPMSKMTQYHSTRTLWYDVIARHCPIFAVNREVLIPIAKPTGYTGTDPLKISLQIGREKFLVPWLFVINRKSSEVPMIDVHLRYSGNDLLGIVAKVVDMPHHYVEIHPDIHKQFWDQQVWPKHMLVRYTWEERSEIDVTTGFYVLFGSGVVLTFILAIYILQSSQDKFAKFVTETVAETNMSTGVVAKVE